MRVILKTDVSNLGRAGDEKNVKDGYARNFLIPRGYVMRADARSEKERAFLERVRERKVQKRKKTAQETAQALQRKEVRLTAKVGEGGKLFGSVTNLHVQKQLEKEGYSIDKRAIIIENPIKNLGRFPVELRFYEGITAEITVVVQDEQGNEAMPNAEAEENEQAETETQASS